MIKDVLVCLEGSASSEAATNHAIGIAREVRAQLAGLTIVDEPDIRALIAIPCGEIHDVADDLMIAEANTLYDLAVADV